MIKNKPRGLRNNNPLNIIRTKSKWLGMINEQTDLRFCQFSDMRWGWRAAFYLLCKVYYGKHKLTTPEQIINRWAPPEDGNNTIRYIEHVCQITGFYTCEHLGDPEKNPAMWMALAWAMARVENGPQPHIDPVPMLQGWRLLWSNVKREDETKTVENDENL